ncbi:MAG: Lrp/AsnC family transcriptional regulator [Deltaproteobacteria bacterium]|nr:Lrp/AsnC family transcriptional regulator [Deltaproteobacteria bacterium]MBW2340434.1 Lrp/AsnC family transcriptional regulator [Deltaproteobacteria bacterium]
MIEGLEKKIIRYLQEDLPVTPKPFASLADKIGIKEEDLLEKIQLLKEKGVLRRFGATLRHQLAGFHSNAMVAWRVPEDKVKKSGNLMAGFGEVSHCYQRRIQGEWKYNLFTMIHGKNEKDCEHIARKIADVVEINDYVVLLTLKEYKKTSPKYF